MKSIQISKAAEVDGSFDENEYIPFFEFIPHGDLCDVTSRMVEFVRIVLRSYGVPLRDGFNPYFDIMDFKILLSFGIRKKFVPPRVEIDIEISLDQNGQKIIEEVCYAMSSYVMGYLIDWLKNQPFSLPPCFSLGTSAESKGNGI